ncbi:BMC domain-containing protein [Schinkia azotoformans]|uniref:BMC domain-containing protein n=1 Tax=Schinkia azotoformans TaxID=1454 RepID=UPI002E22802D|nr:BMC domain-containing protein [Schinkia azotoformans]
MKMTALGLIEVKGYVGAIEAADAALKAANVTLIKLEKIKSGLITVLLSGDVGAIRAAVDAGKEAAEKCSTVISTHVIARPHEETTKVLLQPKRNEPSAVEEEIIAQEQSVVEEQSISIETTVVEKNVQSKSGQKHIFDIEELEGKKVEELRRLARKLHLKNVKQNEIKFGRKEFLIGILSDYYRKGAKE